jgi:formaldehyde-activating enzyme involved in methanogenesis
VLFDDDYCIIRAALIPAAVVCENSTYIEHTNSHKFLLRDAIWNSPDVEDATERLQEVECR